MYALKGSDMGKVPDDWVDYIFRKRRETIVLMSQGKLNADRIYIEFTRTLPAIVSYGPVGLNASVKMVGLMPRDEVFDEFYDKLTRFVETKPNRRQVLDFLLNEIYVEDKLDLTKLFTLDLAKKNTWRNINENKEAVLIFFTPPSKSYMVRAEVTIHTDDKYFWFANMMHDLFHVVPTKGEVVSRSPAYVFHIKEIWDKSADKFGVKIYP